VVILRSRVLPRWLGMAGLAVSAVYLLNQGDVLATAVPGFPVWDLAGLIGSTGWGLWVAALGVTVLRRRIPNPSLSASDNLDLPIPRTPAPTRPAPAGPRS
jgi:Domain of unknown function (DUF4386)